MKILAFRPLGRAFQPIALIVAAFALFSAPATSQPAKSQPATAVKDHPLVGRYYGSELVFSEIKAYDEAYLIQGPSLPPRGEDNVKANALHVEGAISTYQYKLPEERSQLEVLRNYESSLKSKGFQVLFTCQIEDGGSRVKESSCFQIDSDAFVDNPLASFRQIMGATRWPVMKLESCCKPLTRGIPNYFANGGRYLFAKRETPVGTTYVSIALSEGSFSFSGDHDLHANYAFVRVVDAKEMDADKITFIPVKDHPLVGRYSGSELVFSEIKAYDEAYLIQGPSLPPRSEDNVRANALYVEGAVSTYQYKLPGERSQLEVLRKYENSLKSKGFQVDFTCHIEDGGNRVKESSCFEIDSEAFLDNPLASFRQIMAATRWPVMKLESCCKPLARGVPNYFANSGRYLFAKREAPVGTTYVSIALSEGSFTFLGDHDLHANYAFVRVVDTKEMDANMITFIDASEMKKSLDTTGRVNLYGIYFDTDKDTIKPESKPTLEEISKLMKANAKLHLQVVGHTDSTGGDAYNKDLSSRRAASVMHALTSAGIDAGRFTSRGAGASEPVAPNDTEQGRAKNRRVELVGK